MSYTVDASVCARWMIPGEEHEAQAGRIRDDYAAGLIKLCAPTLLPFELLNTIWKGVERRLMEADVAISMCEAFIKIQPREVSLEIEDMRRALEIAVENHITVYDATYIATASKTKTTLIAADSRLLEVARHYQRAMHLKDY